MIPLEYVEQHAGTPYTVAALAHLMNDGYYNATTDAAISLVMSLEDFIEGLPPREAIS